MGTPVAYFAAGKLLSSEDSVYQQLNASNESLHCHQFWASQSESQFTHQNTVSTVNFLVPEIVRFDTRLFINVWPRVKYWASQLHSLSYRQKKPTWTREEGLYYRPCLGLQAIERANYQHGCYITASVYTFTGDLLINMVCDERKRNSDSSYRLFWALKKSNYQSYRIQSLILNNL